MRSLPPPRPPAWQEAVSSRLFRLLAPRLTRHPQPPVPAALAPFTELEVPRGDGRGTLAATWYPAAGRARAAVLMLPPWLVWGRSYFHRRGRLPRLRRAGYHALTVDLPAFGDGAPPAGFSDRALAPALDELGRLAPGLPRLVWGVSAGGYWAHLVLSHRSAGAVGAAGVVAAFFEDVAPHLLEWGWRQAPWGRPGYLFFEHAFATSYRFLDLRRHAPALGVGAVAYAGGDRDPGIPAADTRGLAAAAAGDCLIVPGAGHLAAIKLAGDELIELALATFERGLAAAAG